jgi:hypothetical protein
LFSSCQGPLVSGSHSRLGLHGSRGRLNPRCQRELGHCCNNRPWQPESKECRTANNQGIEGFWRPWFRATHMAIAQDLNIPCDLMGHGPMVPGNRCTELVTWTGTDGSLRSLIPRCRWSREPRSREIEGTWNVGKLVLIEQVTSSSWDRGDCEPRQLGSPGP